MLGRVARVVPSVFDSAVSGDRVQHVAEHRRQDDAPNVTVAATEAPMIDAENSRTFARYRGRLVRACNMALAGLVTGFAGYFAYAWIEAFRKGKYDDNLGFVTLFLFGTIIFAWMMRRRLEATMPHDESMIIHQWAQQPKGVPRHVRDGYQYFNYSRGNEASEDETTTESSDSLSPTRPVSNSSSDDDISIPRRASCRRDHLQVEVTAASDLCDIDLEGGRQREELRDVQRGGPARTAVSAVATSAIPDCSVCLAGYRSGDKMCRLPCAHVFHAKCIDTWLDQHQVCPRCRHNLLPADITWAIRTENPASSDNAVSVSELFVPHELLSVPLPRTTSARVEATNTAERVEDDSWAQESEPQVILQRSEDGAAAGSVISGNGQEIHREFGREIDDDTIAPSSVAGLSSTARTCTTRLRPGALLPARMSCPCHLDEPATTSSIASSDASSILDEPPPTYSEVIALCSPVAGAREREYAVQEEEPPMSAPPPYDVAVATCPPLASDIDRCDSTRSGPESRLDHAPPSTQAPEMRHAQEERSTCTSELAPHDEVVDLEPMRHLPPELRCEPDFQDERALEDDTLMHPERPASASCLQAVPRSRSAPQEASTIVADPSTGARQSPRQGLQTQIAPQHATTDVGCDDGDSQAIEVLTDSDSVIDAITAANTAVNALGHGTWAGAAPKIAPALYESYLNSPDATCPDAVADAPGGNRWSLAGSYSAYLNSPDAYLNSPDTSIKVNTSNNNGWPAGGPHATSISNPDDFSPVSYLCFSPSTGEDQDCPRNAEYPNALSWEPSNADFGNTAVHMSPPPSATAMVACRRSQRVGAPYARYLDSPCSPPPVSAANLPQFRLAPEFVRAGSGLGTPMAAAGLGDAPLDMLFSSYQSPPPYSEGASWYALGDLGNGDDCEDDEHVQNRKSAQFETKHSSCGSQRREQLRSTHTAAQADARQGSSSRADPTYSPPPLPRLVLRGTPVRPQLLPDVAIGKSNARKKNRGPSAQGRHGDRKGGGITQPDFSSEILALGNARYTVGGTSGVWQWPMSTSIEGLPTVAGRVRVESLVDEGHELEGPAKLEKAAQEMSASSTTRWTWQDEKRGTTLTRSASNRQTQRGVTNQEVCTIDRAQQLDLENQQHVVHAFENGKRQVLRDEQHQSGDKILFWWTPPVEGARHRIEALPATTRP